MLFVDVQAVGSPGSGFPLEVAWKPETGPAHSFLVRRSGIEVPARIRSITGISSDDLCSSAAIPVEELRQLFMSAAGLCPGQTPLILAAHHAVYEKKWLDSLTGMDLDFLCTRILAKEQLVNLRSGSLRAVAGHIGYSMGEKRRALEHILATEAIYQALQMGFENVLSKREERLSLPENPGVYRFSDTAGRLLYVGKAGNLRRRVNSHFTGKSKGRHSELISRVSRIDCEILETAFHAAVRESELISTLSPEYNSAGKIRTAELWFLSPDLAEVLEQGHSRACYGPFVSLHPAAEFSRLVQMIHSGDVSAEIVENLMGKAPVQLVYNVLMQWRIQVLEQGILQYGIHLFLQPRETRKKEKAMKEEIVDEQYVRARLDNLLMAGAHMCRKSAASGLLAGSSVTWADSASPDTVHDYVDNSPRDMRDQAEVRKLLVVLSEIKRIYRDSAVVKITTAGGFVLKGAALENLILLL